MIIKLPNIFLIGPMAAGKSTIGRLLAKVLNKNFYDTDQELEVRTGATAAWIYDLEGEEGFQRREELLLDELTQMQDIILATGGGTVLSPYNRGLLAARGHIIYLAVALEQQVVRTRRDRQRPLLYKTNARVVLSQTNAEREPIYRDLADWVYTTDDRPAQQVVEQIVEHLNQQYKID